MAWAGKPSAKQKTAASIKSRTSRKPLPQASNPYGIPPEVMRALSHENLSSDPVRWNAAAARTTCGIQTERWEITVDKGNVDKHRRSMSGLKVEEESKWGTRTAYERFG